MRIKPSQLAFVAVSLMCVLILAACNCAPTLRYITITPSGPTIVVGTPEAFTATGYYSNGSVTPNINASWSSSSTSTATINGTSGVATGVAPGTTTITATAIGISGTTILTVVPATSLTVTPATSTISVTGSTNTQQFDAVANYTGGSMDVTAFATWTATNTSVATFSTSTAGLATGVAAGTTTVTAALSGVSGTANLTVTNAVAMVVTPATATIAIGNSASYTVQEQWADMSLHPPSVPVTWTSSAATQANVIPYGAAGALAAGFAAGTPTITAAEGTITGTSALTVVTGNSHYAYVPNIADLNIGVYTVNATTSPYLTANGGPVTGTGVQPRQTIMNPNGQYLYIVGQQSFTSVYSITNGIPTYTGDNLIGGASNWNYGVIDPYGRFLFELDSGNGSGTYPNGTIYAFVINQTNGTITYVTGSPFTTNLSSARGLVIDHTGQYLYATNFGNNTISAYQIDQTTGALTPLPGGATIPTGAGPEIATLDPTGTYLYVANKNAGSVSSYSIGTGGVLTSLGADTVVPGAMSLINVRVAPSGSFLYVVDNGDPTATPAVNGQLFGFALTSGVLGTTPITTTPIATGVSPTGMDIDPTGVLAAVANSSNMGPGTISLYTIGSGGALTSQAPVTTGNFPLFVTFNNAP
jgi:6-phosphogluconolactonase (cycloisomerase 2 family)